MEPPARDSKKSILTMHRGLAFMITVTTVLLASLVGCSRTSTVTLVPVTGRVTLNGNPVHGFAIIFHPTDKESKTGPASVGVLDREGRFTLLCSGNRRGAIVGEHQVFLVRGETTDEGSYAGSSVHVATRQAPTDVPGQYQSLHASDLRATVTADGENVFEFELLSRK